MDRMPTYKEKVDARSIGVSRKSYEILVELCRMKNKVMHRTVSEVLEYYLDGHKELDIARPAPANDDVI